MKIRIEFGGGVELLFSNAKKQDVDLDDSKGPWTIALLLKYMRDAMLKERPELFLQGETIRPGILILVNDTDWELLGELEYALQENDTVVFISTLHGG